MKGYELDGEIGRRGVRFIGLESMLFEEEIKKLGVYFEKWRFVGDKVVFKYLKCCEKGDWYFLWYFGR